MITSLTHLSEALDQAAPDRKLAAAIRSDKSRIDIDLASKNESFITVSGQTFRIVRKKETSTTG